jgi:creatinine amidohydrolase
MSDGTARWAWFVELRPDQLQEIADESPVAYWPLGLIEHHSWHLPVGLDGLIAREICVRAAERTGGLILPVMWWGGGGGHERFMWTFYQPMDAVAAIFANTVEKLIDFGFRCIIPLPGHGPWHWIFRDTLPSIASAHPDVLILGTPPPPGPPAEAKPAANQHAQHAARRETSHALALFPELVDMAALEKPRDGTRVWPPAGPPPDGERHPDVNFDESSPTFSQAGEDARKADASEAEPKIQAAVDRIAAMVRDHLAMGS